METGWELVFKGEFGLKIPLSPLRSAPSEFNTRNYFALFMNGDCVLRGVKEVTDTEQEWQDFNSIHDIHLANVILAPYTLHIYFHIVQTLD